MAKKYSEKRQRSRRASKLREKQRSGATLTDDEQTWLAAYEATRVDQAAARAAETPPLEGAPAPQQEPPAPPEVEPDEIDTVVEDAPPPKAPPLPRPPRAERAANDNEKETKTKGGDKWQAKYRGGDQKIGREATCKVIADQWYRVLRVLADQIKESGVDPIVDPDDLLPAMVLTIDEVLPDSLELSPRAIALGGTTALLGHRFVRRKEIAAHLEKQKARADHQRWQEEHVRAKERSEAEPIVPTPIVPTPEQPQTEPEPAPVAPINGSPTLHGENPFREAKPDDGAVW